MSVIEGRWVRLSSAQNVIVAETVEAAESWSWLANYLQLQLDLSPVLAAFPNDNPMLEAKNACRGLRLLRQNPWECLASFILSSSKQMQTNRRPLSVSVSANRVFPRPFLLLVPDTRTACRLQRNRTPGLRWVSAQPI